MPPLKDWETFNISYRYRETFYHIIVRQTHDAAGVMQLEMDGLILQDKTIPLVDDRKEHRVEVIVFLCSQPTGTT